jgi:hypothetical protein
MIFNVFFLMRVVQKNSGPPEVATCGRDGCVRVWDVRQHDAPVAAFEPGKADQVLPYFLSWLWSSSKRGIMM